MDGPITIADPITAAAIAALNFANTLAQIYLLELQSMLPEQRMERVQMRLDDLKAWREFWQGLLPKSVPKP